MANVKGDSPSSDELKAHADGPAPDEPVAPEDEEALAGDVFAPDTTEDAEAPLDESAEEEEREGATAEEAEAGTEEEGEPGKVPPYVEWAGVIGGPVIVLALAGLCAVLFSAAFTAFSVAVYLIALGFIPYAIWKGRETGGIYTIFLGLALAALLTATLCLWLEMGRYQFSVKAKDRQRVGMSQGLPFGPAGSTVAAWPAPRSTGNANG